MTGLSLTHHGMLVTHLDSVVTRLNSVDSSQLGYNFVLTRFDSLGLTPSLNILRNNHHFLSSSKFIVTIKQHPTYLKTIIISVTPPFSFHLPLFLLWTLPLQPTHSCYTIKNTTFPLKHAVINMSLLLLHQPLTDIHDILLSRPHKLPSLPELFLTALW